MAEKEGAKKHHEKAEAEEKKAEKSEPAIAPGDVVLADFDAWIQDTKELFDTTSESVAKENDIYNEKMTYGAQPLIVGKGRLFPGLDESMLKAEVGKEYEVVIPAEKGAGPRDPKLVELHPVREFLKQEIEPRVGLEVTVKNKAAIITAVTAGRVRLDFNNRLAGRTLRYKYKVTEKPTKPVEIVKFLLKMSYGTTEGFDIEHHGKTYKVKVSDACKFDPRWMVAKSRFVTDLREIAGAEVVELVEEYVKPAEKKEEPKPEEKPKAEEKAEKKAEKEAAPEKEERAPEELTEEDRKKA
jgi:FKBP-type peptidyl-prolyl cis-trans isomerase 2